MSVQDFRSPSTGLYANLSKCKLPNPTSVFDTHYFRRNPWPFFTFAREIWPSGQFRPTPSHYFIRVLAEQGLLLRNFTQNFDGLERVAGVPVKRLIEAHGTFSSAECIECNREYPVDYVKHAIFADPPEIPLCKSPTCKKGVVRPSLVFFGDHLPAKYHKAANKDLQNADLVIVMGTSLQVRPFCDLLSKIKPDVPRLFINNEHIRDADVDFERLSVAQCAAVSSTSASSATSGSSRASVRISRLAAVHPSSSTRHTGSSSSSSSAAEMTESEDFEFTKTNFRSVFVQSTCDDGVMKMASMIGSNFSTRLRQLIAEDATKHARVDDDYTSRHIPPSKYTSKKGAAESNSKKRKSVVEETSDDSSIVDDRRVSFVGDIPEQNAATLSNTIAEGVARVAAKTSADEVASAVPPKRFSPDRMTTLEILPIISRITFQYTPKLKWSNPRWLLFTTPAPVTTSIRVRWRNVHQLHVHRVHGFDNCSRFATALNSWAFENIECIKDILPLTHEFVTVRDVHAAIVRTDAPHEYDIAFSDPRHHHRADYEEEDDDDDTKCCFKAESYFAAFGE